MTQLDAATGIERALQHISNGEPLLALRVLDRVSWMDLAWPDYWRVRAEAFLMLGDYKQAASNAKEGLVEDPDNQPLLVLHIKALIELGDLDKAQYALLHALRLAPHDLELQSLANALELRLDKQPKEPPAVRPRPVQTIPDVPPQTRDDWKTAKDWRSGKPLFNEADASAIKRAFKANNPTLPGEPKQLRRDFSFLLPIGFLLLGLGFLGYWLWPHMGK